MYLSKLSVFSFFFVIVLKMAAMEKKVSPISSKSIFLAVDTSNIDKVKEALDNGVSVNLRNEREDTLLMRACIMGDFELFTLLLSQPSIDINAQNSSGMTSPMYAAKNGHYKIFDVLLKQPGIMINAKDKFGNTALSLAVDYNQIMIVYSLFQYQMHADIDVNGRDIFGDTALIKASSHGYGPIVELLLQWPEINADITGIGGDTALKAGVRSYLYFALEERACILKLLGQVTSDILFLKNMKIFKKMYSWQDSQSLLDIRNLISQGQIAYGQIFRASQFKDARIIKSYLKRGFLLNIKDDRGNTPLHYAAQNKDIRMIDIILQTNKLLAKVKNNQGLTYSDVLDSLTIKHK